jgi:hypothetical protein
LASRLLTAPGPDDTISKLTKSSPRAKAKPKVAPILAIVVSSIKNISFSGCLERLLPTYKGSFFTKTKVKKND